MLENKKAHSTPSVPALLFDVGSDSSTISHVPRRPSPHEPHRRFAIAGYRAFSAVSGFNSGGISLNWWHATAFLIRLEVVVRQQR